MHEDDMDMTLARSLSDPLAWTLALALVVMLGFAGWQDYREDRRVECAGLRKDYDESLDLCVPHARAASAVAP